MMGLLLGLSMELLVVDMPFGSLISRVVKSSRLAYPVKIKNFAINFIPLLELAYTGKQIMKKNINALDDRKRKKVLDESDSNDDLANVVGVIPLSYKYLFLYIFILFYELFHLMSLLLHFNNLIAYTINSFININSNIYAQEKKKGDLEYFWLYICSL